LTTGKSTSLGAVSEFSIMICWITLSIIQASCF
jgi:hypothetical protein